MEKIQVYEISNYQVEINGVLQTRQTICYWTNESDYLVEEYYGTTEEIRPGFSLFIN
jgi:hypothetical protein